MQVWHPPLPPTKNMESHCHCIFILHLKSLTNGVVGGIANNAISLANSSIRTPYNNVAIKFYASLILLPKSLSFSIILCSLSFGSS